MTKNPIINALCAALYIVVVVTFISNVDRLLPGGDDTIIAPMIFLSLFVLSAATMGYLFLYEPLQMFFDGKRKEATDLFLKTLGAFAATTLVFLVGGLYLGSALF